MVICSICKMPKASFRMLLRYCVRNATIVFTGGVSVDIDGGKSYARIDGSIQPRRIATHMTTKNSRKAGAKPASSGAAPQPQKKSPYVTRYIAVDSHLMERGGKTDSVYGLAGERPAGKKLAQDIANACVQLDAEGYDIISLIPVTSGRAVEATVEAAEQVWGRTYTASVPVDTESSNPANRIAQMLRPAVRYENKHYVDTGVGYSVTDGVMITGKLRA